MYDLIIIGAGSAGLPAGMYASRYKLKNIIIGEMPGGALSTSHCVENFPGVLSAPGAEILKNMLKMRVQKFSKTVSKLCRRLAKIIFLYRQWVERILTQNVYC